MTMITPSYLGETIEYSSLHACRSTLEDPTLDPVRMAGRNVSPSDVSAAIAANNFQAAAGQAKRPAMVTIARKETGQPSQSGNGSAPGGTVDTKA